MILDFTRPLGWTLRDSGRRASFFRDGRSGQITDLESRDLFSIRRCRGCWGRRWDLWLRGLRCRAFSSSLSRRWRQFARLRWLGAFSWLAMLVAVGLVMRRVT